MGLWIPGGLSSSGSSSYVPCEWSTGTDAEIVEALEKHYNDEIDLTEYWSVGDERVVSLSAITDTTYVNETHDAQDVTLVILNVGGKELVTPINGHTTCAFIVGLKNLPDAGGGIYKSANNASYSGWSSSGRRTWCNSSFYNAFPSTLKSIFKQHYNYSSDFYSSTSATQTSDYFCLPSVKEVTGISGNASESAEANNTLLTYYETSANRIKQNSLFVDSYWTSSKYYYTSTNTTNRRQMCYIDTNGNSRITSSTSGLGIAPQGVI